VCILNVSPQQKVIKLFLFSYHFGFKKFLSKDLRELQGSWGGGRGEDEDAEFVANIIFLCVIENVLRKTKTNANSQQILLYTRVNIIIVIITLRVHCCCCCSCC